MKQNTTFMFVYKNKHLSSGFCFFPFSPLDLQGALLRSQSLKSAHIYSNTSMQKK